MSIMNFGPGDDENLDDTDDLNGNPSTEGDDTENGETGDNDAGDGSGESKGSTDGDTDSSDDELQNSEGVGDRRTAKYIRRLKREKRAAERKAEEEARKRQELEAKLSVPSEPKRADFDSDDEYAEAKAEYLVSKRTPPSETPAGEVDGYAKVLVKAGFAVTDAKYLDESFKEAAKKHKDWAKVEKANGVGKELLEGLLEVDEPGEVLFWLANHQDELDRISGLKSARAIAVQLGRVEERIEMGAQRGSAERKVSGAPRPIRPVSGGGKDVTKNLGDNVTDDDWFARRNSELLKRRGYKR